MPDGSGGQFRRIGPSETVALRYIIPKQNDVVLFGKIALGAT